MIKITNGSVEREVTKGAFENLYSKMGYKVFVETVTTPKKEVVKETKEESVVESKKDFKHSSK